METSNNEIKMPPLERKKNKKRKLKPAGIIALVAFFVLCIFFGFWLAGMFSEPLIPEDKQVNPETAFKSPDMLNILLMGVDQRKNEPSRADTIVLAAMDIKKKEVHLFSILRDSRVEIPGKGFKRKINYAHAAGGSELMIKTVEKFLQVPIHYYVETNFEGFSEAIDILGGVTLNVERRMYLPLEGINLKAGLQKLDGKDALAYVRWRGDGRGDVGRVERQQKFFRVLADQSIQFSTVWKIPQLLEELEKHVKTDMSVQKMVKLANEFKDIKNIELHTYSLPGTPDDTNYGGSYWIPDKKGIEEIMEQIYGKDAQDKEEESGKEEDSEKESDKKE